MNTSKKAEEYSACYEELRQIAETLKTHPSLSITQLEQLLKAADEAHKRCMRRIANVESLLPEK